jgi:cysteine desulfurase
MNRTRTYLDWNAGAPLRSEARLAMLSCLELTGNPSSVHAEGRRARAVVERARAQVAALAGCVPQAVVFTSGGTEAANWALTPDWLFGKVPTQLSRAYLSATEHACVLVGGRFAANAIERFATRPDGRADLDDLAHRLERHDANAGRPLVALMAANNETGIVQPVAEAVALTHRHGGVVICDAVQAAGRVALAPLTDGADAVLLSAHKIGGPQGCGALIMQAPDRAPARLMAGGGQEFGRRSGTENVAAIAGFGAAAEAALTGLTSTTVQASLRQRLEAGVLAATPDAVIIGADAARLSNTSLIARPRLSAETLVIQLDLAGIAVSAGAACSSGKVARSHVLEAMGQGDLAGSAIRVSLGAATEAHDIDAFLAAWTSIHCRPAARMAAR